MTEQLAHNCTAYVEVPAAGCGTGAAIGRLTQLTSLELSVGASPPVQGFHTEQQMQRWLDGNQRAPLQLQLLGCGGAASAAGASSAAPRNTGLQELTLQPTVRLSYGEVAAAAAALPALRRLDIEGRGPQDGRGVPGFSGAGLAAYTACRRLRDVSLTSCSQLEGPQLLEHLPNIEGLASLQLRDTPRVGDDAEEELQAAFQARHGRRLQLEFDLDPQSYL
jgi:hypothetical protein